jgi:hypothetical protein
VMYLNQSQMLAQDRMRERLAEAEHEHLARTVKPAAMGRDRQSFGRSLTSQNVLRIPGPAAAIASALHRRWAGIG